MLAGRTPSLQCIIDTYQKTQHISYCVEASGNNWRTDAHGATILVLELLVLAVFSVFMLRTGFLYQRISWKEVLGLLKFKRHSKKRLVWKNKEFILDYVSSIFFVLAILFRCARERERGRQGERQAGRQGGCICRLYTEGGRESGRQGGREAGKERRPTRTDTPTHCYTHSRTHTLTHSHTHTHRL